jgi:hypothetical protein
MDRKYLKKKCCLCGSDIKKEQLILRFEQHTVTGFITNTYDICKQCLNKNPIIQETFESIGVQVGSDVSTGMFELIEKLKANQK